MHNIPVLYMHAMRLCWVIVQSSLHAYIHTLENVRYVKHVRISVSTRRTRRYRDVEVSLHWHIFDQRGSTWSSGLASMTLLRKSSSIRPARCLGVPCNGFMQRSCARGVPMTRLNQKWHKARPKHIKNEAWASLLATSAAMSNHVCSGTSSGLWKCSQDSSARLSCRLSGQVNVCSHR